MLHLVEPEEVGAMRAALNLIGSMVLPMDTSNCSDRHDTPSAPEFLRNLEPFQTVLLSISSVTTIIVLTLSLIHWFYVYNYVSIEKRRNKLYWLIAVFPVACTCSFVAMCVPRTAVILTSIGILYYLMCLFVIVSLARHLFGGRESFSTCLQYDDRPIDFRSPPFCCILPKLPTARSTERNIRRLEWCVLQAPIVRSIIILFDVVAVAELREDATPFIRYSDMATLCSLLLAIFGVHTLARVTSNKLSAYCFMSMFRLVDISLFFFSAQQPIIFQNVLLRFNLISCGPLLNSQENAYFVCNFIITCEMLLLSALATWLLAPRHNAMFDAYRQSMTLSETTASLNETEQSMIEQDI
uniref:Organic solute transporter alpha-like protein n=1 Tax=Caenorhabditis japonica TaxID=281687 RepID=A0A8R1HWK7_CAEJA